jgi:hypothetical protein
MKKQRKTKEYATHTYLDKNKSLNMKDFESMNAQIKEVGKDGMLHFTIETHQQGWMAQCEEIKGIVTGNTNPNPSQEEINSHIRDAVFSAFNIAPKNSYPTKTLSNLVKIETTIAI